MQVRLVVEHGARLGHTFWMRAPEMLVGRKKGCGLRIPSAAVSREHCRLQVVQGILTIEDLGSINGTLLNGEPVTERETIRPGDRLMVGPVTFVVEYEMDQATLDRLAQEDKRRANPLVEFDFGNEEAALAAIEDDSDIDVELPLLEEETPVASATDDLPILQEVDLEPSTDDLPVLEEEPPLEFGPDISLDLRGQGPSRDLLAQLDDLEDET